MDGCNVDKNDDNATSGSGSVGSNGIDCIIKDSKTAYYVNYNKNP